MREIENISSALFDKIRTRFDNISLGDENSKSTTDPEKARFFNFNYVVDGTKFGNVTISLIDENSLKVYFSKDIGNKLDPQQQAKWFEFLRSIRQFAKRNLLSFDTRDIAKSNLQLKDVKQQSKADGVLQTDDVSVTESRMYGTRRSSYQECGPTKIIVRHSDNVNDEVRGARSRNIESVFVETHLGERFLLPFKSLHGARAMAQHMSNGGRMDDELGEGICGMVNEMNAMAHFVREAKRRQFEDAETSDMAQSAVHHYSELKNKLKHLGGRRGYDHYKETYMPECDIEEEVDVDALKERFVKKVYDDRFTDALPYVYRAYQKHKSQRNNAMTDEFESWANELAEGTWALPDQDEEIEQLDKLMAKPISVGAHGENASATLGDIIGDDGLFDRFAELADEQGTDADARPLIIQWLMDNNYAELATKYQPQEYTQDTAALQAQDDAVAQQQQQVTAQTTGATTIDAPNMESADPLDFIRNLAGLRK
jgi:hypothetical protein